MSVAGYSTPTYQTLLGAKKGDPVALWVAEKSLDGDAGGGYAEVMIAELMSQHDEFVYTIDGYAYDSDKVGDTGTYAQVKLFHRIEGKVLTLNVSHNLISCTGGLKTAENGLIAIPLTLSGINLLSSIRNYGVPGDTNIPLIIVYALNGLFHYHLQAWGKCWRKADVLGLPIPPLL